MPEMDTPVAEASWIVVVAARPEKPCNWKLRDGSKMRGDSAAMEWSALRERGEAGQTEVRINPDSATSRSSPGRALFRVGVTCLCGLSQVPDDFGAELAAV